MAAKSQLVQPSNRVLPGSVDIPIGKLPSTTPYDPSIESADNVAQRMVDALNEILTQRNAEAVGQLFIEHESYWRDHLAQSWDLRCFKGREAITHFLADGICLSKFEIDDSSPFRAPHYGPIDGGVGEVNGVQLFITFTTDVGRGRGMISLARDMDGQWRIFMLSTCLQELTGYEPSIGNRRRAGIEPGFQSGRKSYLLR